MSNVSYAYRCGICDGAPRWRIDRVGDAVVSWACLDHLGIESERLQRSWETTELHVRPYTGPVLELPASAPPVDSAAPQLVYAVCTSQAEEETYGVLATRSAAEERVAGLPVTALHVYAWRVEVSGQR